MPFVADPATEANFQITAMLSNFISHNSSLPPNIYTPTLFFIDNNCLGRSIPKLNPGFVGNIEGMEMELLEIQPPELKFTFELKKQSLCSVHLVNKTNEYLAFKVKTTSPKRYCVRPNTGVILPRSTCDFTVTMQAQKTAPPDMQLKDKFLIQSTIAPFGSGEEDIIPGWFSKENGRYIEEHKLRVVLVSPPHSPVLQPINGALKHEPINDASALKETPISKDQVPLIEVENLSPSNMKEVEDLKLKISHLESNLNEASKTIATLREEKSCAIQERDKLQQEIVMLRRRCAARVQVGFPFLFVVFMALVGALLGYLLHQ